MGKVLALARALARTHHVQVALEMLIHGLLQVLVIISYFVAKRSFAGVAKLNQGGGGLQKNMSKSRATTTSKHGRFFSTSVTVKQ